jgi:AGZA family xanthine/uracil permease-like MFS transporter
MQQTESISYPKWFVRRDLDGFFGLALDNLVQILVIVSLTQGILQFPAALVYGRIIPSIALSLIVGNLYYSWLAYQQGKQEGRSDLTALPYGINTVSLFAYVFLVILVFVSGFTGILWFTPQLSLDDGRYRLRTWLGSRYTLGN